MTQMGFLFNANECTGCKACVVACKDVNALPVGYKLRHVVTGEAGEWRIDAASGLPVPQGVFSYSVSYSCMHCSQPACLPKCPRQAIGKDPLTGIVSIDQDACIGCGACARACPWDAPVVVPRIDGVRKARKCDFCQGLLALGEEPACVAACAMRCLKALDLHEPGVSGGAQGAPPGAFGDALLADEPGLGPNMVFVSHRSAAGLPSDAVRVHSMPEEYENG